MCLFEDADCEGHVCNSLEVLVYDLCLEGEEACFVVWSCLLSRDLPVYVN